MPPLHTIISHRHRARSRLHRYYEREEVKAALLSTRRLMSFSTGMITVDYLLPCTNASAPLLQCDPTDRGACVPCPLEPAFAHVDCCVVSERESSNMEGEFFKLPSGSHPEPELEGGHAMALVGFSDVYTTQHGFVGGYILKNSWWDGLPPGPSWSHARGSHSIAYFLQDVSSADEAHVCPNAHSPQNWYRCSSLWECRSSKAAVFAAAANQPLHLECTDASPILRGFCTRGEALFLSSIRPWGRRSVGLAVACFLRDVGAANPPGADDAGVIVNRKRRLSSDAGGEGLLCSPPVPIDDLALVVAPVAAERYANDPDLCGHYFFPFKVAEHIDAQFGGFEVSDMDVRWHKSAYAANAQDFAQLNYTLLRRDTHMQRRVHKSSPFIERQG